MVEIIDNVTKETWSYHLDKRLIPYLEKVKKNVDKKDKDYVALIDGYEGSGKSTFAQQVGRYLDNGLNLSNICMTADEFKQAIINAKKGDCIIYDEAVTGMSSGDSITRIGRLLKSMMMQMRQKNLFVIIIIPAFFELNKYAVLSRAKALFHIYEKDGKRGYFVGYNRKDIKKMYLKGKKSQSYCVRSFFTGKFNGKYVVNEAEYRKKKEEALFMIDDGDKPDDRYKKQRDICLKIIHDLGLSYRQMESKLKDYGCPISDGQISNLIGGSSEVAIECSTPSA